LIEAGETADGEDHLSCYLAIGWPPSAAMPSCSYSNRMPCKFPP